MELSFGQRIDTSNGLCELWLTHGALDEIKAMDLSGKVCFMFGSGLGDAWLAKRCKHLFVVERNQEWLYKSQGICQMNGIENVTYLHRPCNDCSGEDEMYCNIPYSNIDVIINDDAYRTEVCQYAVDYFGRNHSGILISDNWHQDYVWISPKAEEIMKPFDSKIFEQEDHKDHEGNKWKTAIHFIR